VPGRSRRVPHSVEQTLARIHHILWYKLLSVGSGASTPHPAAASGHQDNRPPELLGDSRNQLWHRANTQLDRNRIRIPYTEWSRPNHSNLCSS